MTWVQTGPGAYPASCTVGTGSFSGVKLPGRGADHPPPSKCRGHERVGLYHYPPSGPHWPVIGRTFTVILPSTPSSIRWTLYFTFPPIKNLYAFLVTHKCHMTLPFHPVSFDHNKIREALK